MAALALNLEELHEPTPQEIAAASDAARALARVDGTRPVRLQVEDDEAASFTLPTGVFGTLIRMLAEIGNGNAVTVVPVLAELTTTQAADLLNVSRPHLIKLIERGELKHKMVGTHRKLLARDVLAYQAKVYAAQGEALDAMAALDQQTGLYDEAVPGSPQGNALRSAPSADDQARKVA